MAATSHLSIIGLSAPVMPGFAEKLPSRPLAAFERPRPLSSGPLRLLLRDSCNCIEQVGYVRCRHCLVPLHHQRSIVMFDATALTRRHAAMLKHAGEQHNRLHAE